MKKNKIISEFKNITTGFINPRYEYHQIIGLKNKKEAKKWAIEKKLTKCLEIFYETKFKGEQKKEKKELAVYRKINGKKIGSPFRCDNYANVNNHHVDYEFNGPDHYCSAFKINTDSRKAETMKTAANNTDENNNPGKEFKIFKVPYYLQLTKDLAKYLFHDQSIKKLGQSYYSDEKYIRAIKTLYNTNDERKVLAPGLHNSKQTFANFNEPGMKRFLKEMNEMSVLYPSIKHQVIYSLQLYIDDVGKDNDYLIVPKKNKEFNEWFNFKPEDKYLNLVFLRDKRELIY